MLRVLHVLPHPGGGAETYVDALERLPDTSHERMSVSAGRSPLAAAVSLPARRPAIARRAREADLVHAHGDMAAALAAGVLRSRPSVWSSHGLHFLRRVRGPAAAVFRRRLRGAIAAAEVTICTSQAELDELAEVAGPQLEPRLRLVLNGIALPDAVAAQERAAARAELDLGEGTAAVLFLGQLEERKAPLDAVAAAEAARAAGHDLVLLVAGDGPLAAEVERRAGPAVRALGFRDDVRRLLAAADALVLPSEREGLAMSLLEAMGHGVPVVVSDGPGNPEAVGEAGLVVPYGDVEALGAALGSLAANPAERERLGAAGRERVAGPLGEERFLAETGAAYELARGSA